MIVTEFYKGQGLGNQLWCYVTTRVIALNKGYDFGIQSPELFKGLDFMDLDFGKQVFGGKGPEGGPPQELPQGITQYYQEHRIIHPNGSDIRTQDKNLINILDDTKIDGCMQDVAFIAPKKDEVREWLKVRPEFERYEYSDENICVINFRGGSYAREKDFFLPQSYWDRAVAHMLNINPHFKFVVITDDVKTAKTFFPRYDVFHFSIAEDYSIIKNAKYLILSNSSFAWFPAWLNEDLRYCIAPKYWARHNISDGYWSLGYNITPGWMYQDRDGTLQDYDTCLGELNGYIRKHESEYKVETPFNPSEPYTPKQAPRESKFVLLKKLMRVIDFRTRLFIKRKIFEYRRGITESKSKKTWLSPQEIAKYRKKIRICDAFTFFNELDLLEIRLNILDPYVDYFAISEATETFSGHSKPLHFAENRERFKKWEHKIMYYPITDVPKDDDDLRGRLHSGIRLSILDKQLIRDALTTNNITRDVVHWLKEFYIKESLKKAIVNTGLKDDDFCFISDLDEVWNPELLIDYSKDDVFKPKQIGYQYFLNNRSNENDWDGWTGTIGTKYKNIKHACINHLRTHRKMRLVFTFLENGGWHFAFQGGYEGAKRKIVDAKHFWYEPEKTLPVLAKRVAEYQDHRGRKHIKLWKDECGLPKYLLENKERYQKFFRD